MKDYEKGRAICKRQLRDQTNPHTQSDLHTHTHSARGTDEYRVHRPSVSLLMRRYGTWVDAGGKAAVSVVVRRERENLNMRERVCLYVSVDVCYCV